MSSALSVPTVMLVDDTPANLGLLEEILRSQGYRVVAFPRGAMALRAAAANPPDLILLDVMMPEMDGFEVCRHIKENERLNEIPVIFISALDDADSKVRAFAAGGVDYVSKPFNEAEVLARVAAHLRLHRQQMEIESQKRQVEDSLERLRDLEAQRDQLVHMIVHDMRSPLMGILGFAELLLEDLRTAGQERLAESALELMNSGRKLQNMINLLLDISRMESNQMPLEPEHCDLRDIVASALSSLGALLMESTVHYEPPQNPVAAYCDPEIARRCVENLVANAIKFTGNAGSVCIKLTGEPGSAKLGVADSGPGIPPEYVSRIFEKFTQVAARKEGRNVSTGLGLAFCKLAVEAQGGRIGVESVEGEGSTFWFTVPEAASDPSSG